MKTNSKRYSFKKMLFLSFIFISITSHSQNDTIPKAKSAFCSKVNFGGGLGLSIGNGFTSVSVSPTMYYNVSEKVALGIGLNGSYIKSRNEYNSWIYGGSVVGIINPIEFIQLSTELEQLRVNTSFEDFVGVSNSRNFWNTALFLGAGYRSNNFTIGLRYNVLHDKNNFIYSDPWMPFVRVIF